MKKICLIFSIISLLAGDNIGQSKKLNPRDEYISTLKMITDIMVSDVTSPVAAARYYGYITLTAYEVLSCSDSISYPSMQKQIKFPALDVDHHIRLNDTEVQWAVNLGMLKAAEKLLPSGPTLAKTIETYSQNQRINPSTNSLKVIQMVNTISNHIVKWARADGFLQLNNLKRYTPKNEPEYWQPTAPVFMSPIEPQWRTIRPFLMDSAQQFKPMSPIPYSQDKNSTFYQLMKETYDIGNRKNEKEQEIAMFWDCNPFAIQQIGHIEFGIKKISPGGHWMGIAGIACKKGKLKFGQTVLAHALLGITMHDAFIACWDEKYRSDRVRPETAINLLLDPRWRPLLQTPPFPEYVSGHSVVSSASSVVLTKIFGQNFSYTDDSEVEFGIKKRKFKSFSQAAEEASISRLYGGIHFRDGIEQGVWQGREVGKLSVLKLKPFFEQVRRINI